MSSRFKKILLIIIFIIVVIIIAFAIYYLFFRKPAPTTQPISPISPTTPVTFPPTPPAITLPPTAVNQPPTIPPTISGPQISVPGGPTISTQALGGITIFSTLEETPVLSPTLANNGQDLIYYNQDTGFFYNVNPQGEKITYSDIAFKNVQNVVWAPNDKMAIMEFKDGAKMLYDFTKKSSVTIPSHWKDFSFSGDSTKIAFKDMKLDPENRTISVSNANGSSYKYIEDLGDEDRNVHVSWAPNNKYVALFIESLDADRSIVYPIGFNGENYKSFRVEGRDLEFTWSPSGNKLLYSVQNAASEFKPTLWVVNTHPDLIATGRNKINLDTWAEKCTFSSETIAYCAVPKELELGAGFVPSLADATPDDIYKIDISTGVKELIAQPALPTTIDKLIVSSDGNYLYFLEKSTNQIKKINL